MESLTLNSVARQIFMDDIRALDFTMIKRKLQKREQDQGWTKSQANEIEASTKNFLLLKEHILKETSSRIKPLINSGVNTFLILKNMLMTATRVLDTFCIIIPYFGMNGKQDAQNLTDTFEETKVLYKFHFNEDYVGMARRCTAPKCRTQCKPMKCK